MAKAELTNHQKGKTLPRTALHGRCVMINQRSKDAGTAVVMQGRINGPVKPGIDATMLHEAPQPVRVFVSNGRVLSGRVRSSFMLGSDSLSFTLTKEFFLPGRLVRY